MCRILILFLMIYGLQFCRSQDNSSHKVEMKLAYDLIYPPSDKEMNLPPVILLHGIMDSKNTWKNLAPKIAQNTGRKVYALDARNHGESPWDNKFNFNILSDDLLQFLNDHGIPNATFVGHSLGGTTVMTFALKQPERVEKIVIEDVTPESWSPFITELLIVTLDLLTESLKLIPPDSDELTAKKLALSYLKPLLPIEEKIWDSVDLDLLPSLKKDGSYYSWHANIDVIQDFLSEEKNFEDLSGIYMGDALFIYGKSSFFDVETSSLIPKHFPRAVKVKFEEANHFIHLEFPSEFENEVVKFINRDVKQVSEE